jgi:hypothetical protein
VIPREPRLCPHHMDLTRFRIPPGEAEPVHAIISRRRRQVLVHSILYYRFDDPLIDDATFDLWAQDLVELQRTFPGEAAECPFHETFRDFDGSTGFHLPLYDPRLTATARSLLKARDARQAGET